MFEINRENFGAFLSERRKQKGYTQKQLAGRLFVSDKAVSKWERGLSMPDITLLIPLADILEVSVTELLEGRQIEKDFEMGTEQVELLVKKTLALSEESPEKKREKRRKKIYIFLLCGLLVLTELAVGILGLKQMGIEQLRSAETFLTMEGLSVFFGIYIWFFMKERLPAYYDENKISIYSDGVFRMSMMGLHFNNSNWPHIIKGLRLWSVISMVVIPLFYLVLSVVQLDFWWSWGMQMLSLLLYLGGLFLPVYVLGKKYE